MKCTKCKEPMTSQEKATYHNRCENCYCLTTCGTESQDYRRITKMGGRTVYLRPSEYKQNKGKK